MPTQHTNMHAQNANMTYPHNNDANMLPTWHAICMCNKPSCMAKCMRTTATCHSPKIKSSWLSPQGDSLHHALFEEAKPAPLGNKYKG